MAVMSSAQRAARRPWVGWLGRAGFAAQGTCFLIIGALALELAFGDSGRLTDPRGAFIVLAQGGWTRVLLVLLAIGFACYSLWRLAQAVFDRGGMGNSPGGLGRRAIQLGQSVMYALLAVAAVRVLLGSRGGGGTKRAAAGILGWPGGVAIVAAIGVALGIIAAVNVYWGLSRRFMESLDQRVVEPETKRLLELVGTIGFLALGFVLGVVAWFMLKAAIDFNAGNAVSLGGAMSELARATYGTWLLAAVAVGLLAYGLFGILQSRYHRV
jgi:TRAP-type mannitol/chloroaromatic compound transport system permease small subunit